MADQFKHVTTISDAERSDETVARGVGWTSAEWIVIIKLIYPK